MGEKGKSRTILVEKPQEIWSLGIFSRRWEGNISNHIEVSG